MTDTTAETKIDEPEPLYKLYAKYPNDFWLKMMARLICRDKLCTKTDKFVRIITDVGEQLAFLEKEHPNQLASRLTIYEILEMIWLEKPLPTYCHKYSIYSFFDKDQQNHMIDRFVSEKQNGEIPSTLSTEIYFGIDYDNEEEVIELKEAIEVLMIWAKSKKADELYDFSTLYDLDEGNKRE